MQADHAGHLGDRSRTEQRAGFNLYRHGRPIRPSAADLPDLVPSQGWERRKGSRIATRIIQLRLVKPTGIGWRMWTSTVQRRCTPLSVSSLALTDSSPCQRAGKVFLNCAIGAADAASSAAGSGKVCNGASQAPSRFIS